MELFFIYSDQLDGYYFVIFKFISVVKPKTLFISLF